MHMHMHIYACVYAYWVSPWLRKCIRKGIGCCMYTAYAVVLTKYCLNHCARTCCSLRNVTRCRFTNWRLRCERGGRTFIFLASIWLAVAGHVVLFWIWLPRRGRWTAPVDSEIQRKICEMLEISVLKGYQVEALYLYGSTNAIRCCVCADWDQKLCVFWSRRNPHRDRPRHCQWASSLVQRLWLARFIQAKYALWYRFEKRPPVTLRRSQISSDAVAVR